MKQRFILQDSELNENHSFCTDTENMITCTFENKKFNDTQNFKFIEDQKPDVSILSKAMREMGDWLVQNHSDKI